MNTRRILIAVLAVVCVVNQAAFGRKKIDESLIPEWTVPMSTKPPVIDGKIELGEWDRAVSATGLVDYLSRFIVARQARVWLTFDRKYVYAAMRSPLPGHGRLKTKQKRNDVRWVFADDAIEIVIHPYRDREGESGFKALYHMIFNSIDTVYDMKRCKGIGQNFINWNTSAERGHSLRNGNWEFEIRIPASDFGLKEIPPGTTWRIAIVRNWKNPSAWATITPGYSCNNSDTYVQAHFVEKSPVFQLEELGNIREGHLNLKGEIAADAEKDGEFEVQLQIRSEKDNRLIVEETKTILVSAQTKGDVGITTDFAMAEKNLLQTIVRSKTGGAPIFKHSFLFKRMTEDEQKALVQWNAPPKPKDKYGCKRHHFVTKRSLETEFDFSEYKHKDRVNTAQVLLLNKRGKTILQGRAEVNKEGQSSVQVSVEDLRVGTYKVQTAALGSAGKVIGEQAYPFEIKEWPWLGNSLGKSNNILPPYTPLETKGRTASCLGRRHVFDKSGLITQIESRNQDLLVSPQTLRAVVNGKKVDVEVTRPFAFNVSEPHKAEGTASLKLGKLPVQVHLTMEYDGWILYRLTLEKTSGVQVDLLDMEFPLPLALTPLYHVVGERHTDTLAGEIPPGKGVVWDSRTPHNTDILGTFQPYVWLGNEKAGLCWMAESDRGWHTDDNAACIDLVRDIKNKVTRLRFHLINLPTPMKKDRQIVFGIMATPSKPMPEDWRRWSLWDPGAPRRPSKILGIDFTRKWCHGFGGSFYPKNHDYTIIEYPEKMMKRNYTHPTFYTGFGYMALNYPELQYFKTEWLGKEYITYSHVDRFADRKYWGNDTKAYITSGAALTDSFMDFLAWYYDLLFKKTAYRAIYYDLFNPGFTTRQDLGAYIRDDGMLQKAADVFRKRELLKRIATIMHDNGLEIIQIVHMTGTTIAPNLSFAQIAFDAEMRFPPEGRDHMDTWTFDLLRAETMGKQYGLVPFFLQGGKRDLVGMLAAHDILECRGGNKGCMSYEYQEALVDFGVGIGNKDVEFFGYWENSSMVRTADPDVFCSFYRRPGKAFFVFVNRSREKKTVSAELDWNAIGIAPVTCRDPQQKKKLKLNVRRNRLSLDVPGHDYRVVVAEESE